MKITAEDSIASAFLESWTPNYGVPLIINAYRGSQLHSVVFQVFTRLLGVNHMRTIAYYLQRIVLSKYSTPN